MRIFCCFERRPPLGRISLVGQYGSSCLPAAEISRRHDETPFEAAVSGGTPGRGLQMIARGARQLAEVCLSAPVKPFSRVCRRLFVVMGSLEERRCSRITRSAGHTCLSKAIFAWRSVGKMLFQSDFFPELIVRFLWRKKGAVLQVLKSARQDDVGGIPLFC